MGLVGKTLPSEGCRERRRRGAVGDHRLAAAPLDGGEEKVSAVEHLIEALAG